MKPSEAAQVLTAAALVDKRTIGEADARMWAEILPETIGPKLAVEAVKEYYRHNREWIMPADISRYAEQVRRRLDRDGSLDIDALQNFDSNDARISMIREYAEARIAGLPAAEANTHAVNIAAKQRPIEIEGVTA